MRVLFILLAVLLVTAVVTLLALNNPGYVMLGYGKTSLEMPLIDFLVILAGAFLAFYFLVRFLTLMRKTPKKLRGLREKKQINKSRKGLTHGLIEMAEGNWAKAEKQLVSSAKTGDTAMLNYLAAAHSAERQNASDRRDEYLRLASETSPDARVAVGLTQAELQIRQKQYEEALASLQQLEEIAPKHPQVQKQLAKLLYQLQDWDRLYEMLPGLNKNQIITTEEFNKIQKDVATGLIEQTGQTGDAAGLDELWKNLPKSAKQEAEIIAAYTRQLIRVGGSERAEPLLRKSLNHQWDDRLAAVYGLLQLNNPKPALKQTEKWLHDHSDSADLLMAAARFSAQAKLWGQARSLYQESLNLKPQPRTYAFMGELLETMGEAEAARTAYQTGLKLVTQG
ncbi:MAG TPA: heme biosynthesis protein HemY [Chromatiales bacterium]|nr:heme biosynthesis protein HemY [Thiotrichales bacterium]HIP68388.1 heme biosynthesis protein HemY [Chromatiales bacterium]